MRVFFISMLCLTAAVIGWAGPIRAIVVDGEFDDWENVPSHSDPPNDTHDTDHDGQFDVPNPVSHPDVDLLEFKITHDEENLYAYFRSAGVIGRTQNQSQGTAGRYYVIVTIDVDNNDDTGYWLHEGGYYPTTPGYDMNMEVEFYDGTFNTGHYLNHGCRNQAEFLKAQNQQSNGWVKLRPGTYDWYTQWVYWDFPTGFPEEIILPNGGAIVWVLDKGPVYQGILEIGVSDDGHEAEMKAPFRGFLNRKNGNPIMKLGRRIDVSFSLEASSELAPGGQWASDTANPVKYKLGKKHANN